MIVSGGENVFPAEVEDLLMGHENVSDVAVFGVDDEKYGQRLKAVIVKKGSLTEKAVQDYVKKNLAGYKAPRDVVFVDELPRTSTGKVLKRELQDRPNLRVHASAHRHLRSGAPPAHLRRGPAPGPARHVDPFEYGGSRYVVVPDLVPARVDVSRTTANGWAMRLRFEATLDGPCMRCLDPAEPSYAVDSYEVHQPGRATRS